MRHVVRTETHRIIPKDDLVRGKGRVTYSSKGYMLTQKQALHPIPPQRRRDDYRAVAARVVGGDDLRDLGQWGGKQRTARRC